MTGVLFTFYSTCLSYRTDLWEEFSLHIRLFSLGVSFLDIAGKNIANPIATVLSAAMMLRYSLDLDKEAEAVENAVQKILKDGYRTVDIMSEGCKKVSTSEMGDLLVKALE